MTLNNLFQHRSIRRYKSQEIPEKDLELILEAATRASTTGNIQAYSIVVSREPSLRAELRKAHFNQAMVEQAPVHLTFCADFHRFSEWCRLRGAEPGYDNFLSFSTAAIDAVLASQNAALAAETLGYGICYLGTVTYMADRFVELLRLPQGVVPVAALVLGVPDEDPPVTDRLPMEAVVHWETYQEPGPERVAEFYESKEANPDYQKFVSQNGLPSLAHVFTDVRYKKADNLAFSRRFLDLIAQQGFMNNG